jgi:hypothetical protein
VASASPGSQAAAYQTASAGTVAVATAVVFTDSVDLEFPAYLIALEASAARAKFRVTQAGTKITVEFQQWQSAFIINTNSPLV